MFESFALVAVTPTTGILLFFDIKKSSQDIEVPELWGPICNMPKSYFFLLYSSSTTSFTKAVAPHFTSV